MSQQNLDYWIAVTECNCRSPLPTGGCLHCDLEALKLERAAMLRWLTQARDRSPERLTSWWKELNVVIDGWERA